MNIYKNLILIKGEDKTTDIEGWEYDNNYKRIIVTFLVENLIRMVLII